MYGSDSLRWPSVVLLGIALLVACDDPTALRIPPEIDAMRVLLILDPDKPSQPALVTNVAAVEAVESLIGEMRSGGETIAGAAGTEPWDNNELRPCIGRYGTLVSRGAQLRCLDFQATAEHGAAYHVTIQAAGRPALSGTTRVPGDFRLLNAEATGSPPGTEVLRAVWSPSDGAYRYLVGLRSENPPWGCGENCYAEPDRQGWLLATADTVIETVVSGQAAEEIATGSGNWYVDVYAVDRGLYEYLMTGTPGHLFPVPPLQNVDGGYGVVGSWVRRSFQIR